ncbi:MAG: hypothetical protein II960_06270 [Synergistaceae bacterium]|nr:hypothetical protein [Synergistaceae bacterium]
MNKNKFFALFLLSVIALFYSVPSWGAAAWYVKPGETSNNLTQVNFISRDLGGGITAVIGMM